MTSIPDVKQLFDESEPGDWNYVESDFGLVDADRGIHPMWVYEHDVDLRIERGRVAVEDFEEEWSEKVPDTEHNQSYTYWLIYRQTPIEQQVVVSVDGGRADIAVPNPPESDEDTWTIGPRKDKYGAIISRNYSEYKRRLEMCDIEVVNQ